MGWYGPVGSLLWVGMGSLSDFFVWIKKQCKLQLLVLQSSQLSIPRSTSRSPCGGGGRYRKYLHQFCSISLAVTSLTPL